MSPIRFAMLCFALSAAFGLAIQPALLAQEDETSTTAELRLIRQLLEQQSRQIDILTKQLASMEQRMPGGASAGATPSSAGELRDTPPQIAVARPVSDPAPLPPPAPTPPQKTHTVARGETLTSIAKLHGTTIAELVGANTITDDRKLQIGQILVIPVTATEQPPIEEQ